MQAQAHILMSQAVSTISRTEHQSVLSALRTVTTISTVRTWGRTVIQGEGRVDGEVRGGRGDGAAGALARPGDGRVVQCSAVQCSAV